tara:strand:- start:73 stop:222 length:150 start_codon:yes stop_codon:yes gene_type:complete
MSATPKVEGFCRSRLPAIQTPQREVVREEREERETNEILSYLRNRTEEC